MMKKIAFLALLALVGTSTAIADEHHVTISTSCGYDVDMIYDTDTDTVEDMINDALLLEDLLCGDDENP